MKIHHLLLILLLISYMGYGQFNYQHFGNDISPEAQDTLTTADSVSMGRTIHIIYYAGSSFTLHGHKEKISGSDTTVAVFMRLLLDKEKGEYSQWYLAGTIAEGDSIPYTFPIASQSWWTYCDGYQVKYEMPDEYVGSIKISSKAKLK